MALRPAAALPGLPERREGRPPLREVVEVCKGIDSFLRFSLDVQLASGLVQNGQGLGNMLLLVDGEVAGELFHPFQPGLDTALYKSAAFRRQADLLGAPVRWIFA